MYKQATHDIRNAFECDPAETLEAVVRFVLATIQQQFHTVPAILEEWYTQGFDAPTMWGMKAQGVEYIREEAPRLAALLRYALSHGTLSGRESAIDTLLDVPGLNTVKAAFVAQCIGFEVGCIDTQNAKIYDVDPASFRIGKSTSAKTRQAKIASYCTMCDKLGGAQQLWDVWCTFISEKYTAFQYPSEVSDLHTLCIIHRPWEGEL